MLMDGARSADVEAEVTIAGIPQLVRRAIFPSPRLNLVGRLVHDGVLLDGRSTLPYRTCT